MTGLFNRIFKGFPKFPFCYKGIYSYEEATRQVKLEDLVGPLQQTQKSLLNYEEHWKKTGILGPCGIL